MSCKDYQKQIILLLDGKLHQKLANELNSHLNGCKSCREALEKLSKAYSLIELEKSEFKNNPFLSAKILAKIDNKRVSSSDAGVSLRYLTIVSLAAAGIALGILIGTLYNKNRSIEASSTIQTWDQQLADEYMPEVENNPYKLVTITNETPKKP
ncbi:MAG: zf-HC2 domain-containing protein [Bacteroidales bacterium]|nr:zf-HC2 domain-containing protein [Bacteroidales bacterium]